MADLKYDSDAFTQAINRYDYVIESIRKNKDNLIKSMSDLKTYWKSDAEAAFEDFYNENWVAHVELYIAVLEQLSAMLKKASTEYEELANRVPQIYSE